MLLLVCSILFNAAGQLLLKRAAIDGGAGDPSAQRAFLNPWFLAGTSSLGVSMLFWVLVLRKMPLTLAHPVATCCAIVMVPTVSHLIWNEPLGPLRIVGIAVIAAGVIIVARG
jgi:undecaprenyl phosphate-alpha-L-ara4N flippase subunit ArnE